MASVKINYAPWGGITVCFNEAELQSILGVEGGGGQLNDVASAIAEILGPVPLAGTIADIIALYLDAEQDLAKHADKGNGVCFLLPWGAIYIQAYLLIIPYSNGSAPPFIENDQQHVDYMTTDGNIHELWYSSSWQYAILTDADSGHANVTGVNLPDPELVSGLLDGYGTPWNGQQHINYIGRDGNVHELLYTNNVGWTHGVLTDAQHANVTGVNLPFYKSPLNAYATYWNSVQHINYISPSGDVHQLWYSGENWQHSVLTDSGNANVTGSNLPQVNVRSAMNGYATPWNNGQSINYIGQDGGVHQLYGTDTAGWQHAILTASNFANVTGQNLPASGSPLVGYITQWNSQQHIDYIGRDGNIHELMCPSNGGWSHAILSNLANATGVNLPAPPSPLVPGPGSPLAGFATPWNQQQHVDYYSADSKVHELLYTDTGGWTHGVLTDANHANVVSNLYLPALFSPLNAYMTPWNQQQHVDYVGQDGKIHELWYSNDGGWTHDIVSDQASNADSGLPDTKSGIDGYAT